MNLYFKRGRTLAQSIIKVCTVTEVCIDIEEFEDDYEEVISLILFLDSGNSVSLSFIAYDNPYNLSHESLTITKVGI